MVSMDRIFELLSKKRRRYALYYLDQQEGPVLIDEVAAQVAEWESDPGIGPVPEGAFDGIELKLYHVDLPKASETTYIQYNPDEGTVELTETPPSFAAILSIAKVIERPDRNP
ncbi:DUF7344 domain-containing protein [Halorarum halobium]|uniref:DUF7344 domain-containing protein n=1 Tax=Halorarum halobium TaxID=3075121 RepID=UPI0028B21408|nr:hypothetical protein [Halobaculum sp. XH14]